jgi:hypothetical protein
VVFAVGEGQSIVVVVGVGVVQRGVPMDDRRRMFVVSPMNVLGGQHQCHGHSVREYERSKDAPQGRPSHEAVIMMAAFTGDVNMTSLHHVLLHGFREGDGPLSGGSVPLDRHAPRSRHVELGTRRVPPGHVGSLHINRAEHRHSWHRHVRRRADVADINEISTRCGFELDDE